VVESTMTDCTARRPDCQTSGIEQIARPVTIFCRFIYYLSEEKQSTPMKTFLFTMIIAPVQQKCTLSTVSSLMHATQETQGFTHALCKQRQVQTMSRKRIDSSNLMQAISRDKFQPCCWPLLAYVAFVACITCIALCL